MCLKSLTSVLIRNSCKKVKKFKKGVDKKQKAGIIVRVENNNSGPLVKGLRHRLFTAVTRVRIPYGLFWRITQVRLKGTVLKTVRRVKACVGSNPTSSFYINAGWSSSVARRAHNPKVVGSNPAPAIRLGSSVGRAMD